MKKVFAVSTGRYSDYHILRIFSSEELAKKWLEGLKDTVHEPDYRIEEYLFDDLSSPLHPHVWVAMELHSGNSEAYSSVPYDTDVYDPDLRIEEGYPAHSFSDPKVLMLYMDFDYPDKDTAVKACNEKRTQLLAAGIGTPGCYDRNTLAKKD